MKKLKSIMSLMTFAIIGSYSIMAQSYYDDDIYYNPDKVKKNKVEKQKQQNNTQTLPGSDTYTVFTSNNRDVDEYNRRNVATQKGDSSLISTAPFTYTNRIERFYNADIVSGSNDEELQEYYYSSQIAPETTTINLIIEPDYGWYSPFYSPWYGYGYYNPWYYSSWGYWDPWYNPVWWGPSYAWNWGWGPSWSFGWGPSWNWGWTPGWGGAIYPGPSHAHRVPTGAMATHRPSGNHQVAGNNYYEGRRGPVVNGNNRRPTYNNSGNNKPQQTSRPSNTTDQRRGGNVPPANNYQNYNNYNNYNHNSSNSSFGGGNRGGASFGSGSMGGGARSGGGSHGTVGRRR